MTGQAVVTAVPAEGSVAEVAEPQEVPREQGQESEAEPELRCTLCGLRACWTK